MVLNISLKCSVQENILVSHIKPHFFLYRFSRLWLCHFTLFYIVPIIILHVGIIFIFSNITIICFHMDPFRTSSSLCSFLSCRWQRRSASHYRPPRRSPWCLVAAQRLERPNSLERCLTSWPSCLTLWRNSLGSTFPRYSRVFEFVCVKNRQIKYQTEKLSSNNLLFLLTTLQATGNPIRVH